MSTTRAATFSAKIRTLSEFQVRLSTNQQPPSNAEIITTLRYFQQTLIGFLKDVPPEEAHICEKFSTETTRCNLFPNLNYSGLFYAVVNLIEVFPLIQSGQIAIGEAILDTIKALLVFIDKDCLEQLPLLLATQLGVLPSELDRQLVHTLADCVLPYALCEDTSIKLSLPATLMLVLQHGSDPGLHTWIAEAAMNCSSDVYTHLVQVAARGTSESRVAAANLLFHYWAFANPHVLHRKCIQYKVHAWSPIACQSTSCSQNGSSVKKCYDPIICADVADTSPPVFLCKSCADNVVGEKKVKMFTLSQPMPSSNATCQNRECQSQSRLAIGICFSHECSRTHNHVPVRLCLDCYNLLHPPDSPHLAHRGSGCVWGTPLQWHMVEAIVKLLRETTQFEGTEGEGKRPKWLRQLEGGHSMGKEIDRMADERRMLSRFGVWLVVALCPPTPDAPKEALSYIMSNLFQWFSTTALLPNDSMGASLEQLKTDFVCDWINLAIRTHYEVFLSVLRPPTQEVDGRPSLEVVKEGLSRLLALMPYDVISLDAWSAVMPLWLQFIYENTKEEDQAELKVLLCKIFEADLCALPFEISMVFEFIRKRLLSDNYDEVFDTLQWIHLLCRMDISIPLDMLVSMFSECLHKLPTLQVAPLEARDLEEDDVSIHVIIVDVILLQLRLNDISAHEVSSLSESLFGCISCLLMVPLRTVEHVCKNPELDGFTDCSPCQQAAFVQQMIMHITEAVSPKQQIDITTIEDEPNETLDEISTPTSHPSTLLSPVGPSGSRLASPAAPTVATEAFAIPGLQFQTAKMEEEAGDEFVGILPSEEVETAMAQAVTLTDTDVGREKCQVVTSSLIQGMKETPQTPHAPRITPTDFWDTSVGRFRFTLEQLPSQLKMIHSLLSSLDSVEEPDVEYFVMSSLKFLCLHCEALTHARREHRGFLIWLQENMFVPKLWARLRADFVQVAELSTLLLLHALTFASGEEMFWNVVNRDFTNRQWTVRFDAVGKGYAMAHMLTAAPVKNSKVVQRALSSLFYHLVVSLHDPNTAVAQRAVIALHALPRHTLKLICLCFESQFDACIRDRPLLVNAIRVLITQLPEESTLSFDFFIQRFETIVLESQLSSKSEDTLFVQDLMHSDPMSDAYQRKLSKAKKALEDAATAPSILKKLRQFDAMRHQLVHLQTEVQAETDVGTSSATSATYTADGYGRLREFTDEESNMCLLINRVVDIENPERHTVYLIISLFVTFLSNKNSTPTDEKANAKKQSLLFRHFNTLLGYSNTEKCFTIPPARLRMSVVCNAFMSGLTEILDTNLVIGNQLLPTVVQLLIHLPSPQKLASDQQTNSYSLKPLSQHCRHLWLNAVILILYKYRFDQVPISDGVLKLMNIVIRTLKGQVHVCAEGDKSAEVVAWDDVSDEEQDSNGLVRPESLTVTTIQESDTLCAHPTIIEPRNVRKRSEIRRKTEKKQQRAPQTVELRCGHCNELLESFDEESLSLCLIATETFLHREPAMAAPILLDILQTVTRLVDQPLYPWHDSDVFVPGNCKSVAKQMLRVTLHQLSSSGICLQLFDSRLPRQTSFWNVIALSLADFNELSPVYFIQLLLEDLAENWPSRMSRTVRNLATYIVNVSTDSYMSHWSNVVVHLEAFFRRYQAHMSTDSTPRANRLEVEGAIVIMTHVLKVQNFSAFKSAVALVESFCKWLADALHVSPVKLESLLALCTACNRALIRERDKQCITRAVVAELIQAIKLKCSLHESNYITIADIILQDAGEDIDVPLVDDQYNTAASETVRPFLFEILDFVADLHVLAKFKKETSADMIGGDLKVKLAEAIAVEMSRSNSRDCRSVIRFIPWLMSPPSLTQAAPGAFADSVTNVRVLSWLLLGAVHANQQCTPVPIECSQHIADYIHFVLAGFADQSKQSVVHMSALFHAFHLCQLWTVYCERAAMYSSSSAFANLLDFWARVTPAILQLLCHSKVLADMVNLHFLNTIQALQQVNSALLCQLYSMWSPILTAYHNQIPNQLRIKLDSCENQPQIEQPQLSEWLKRVRYKISQVELQTSAASPFYNV